MNLPPFLLRGRKQMIIGVAGLILLLLIVFSMRSCGREEAPDLNALKYQHLDYLVQVLDAYYQRNGAYPLPSVRRETPEGMRHVWGYRATTPAFASCTVMIDDAEAADPLRSFCGGNVYDAKGSVIGWKGTIAPASGLNSLAAKSEDVVSKPIADLVPELPMDPEYVVYPSMIAAGFGEYIYAVRRPEDGDMNRGAQEYQLAATVRDPMTGSSSTVIRGNYFVRSDEISMPPSLIGPGLLVDSYGRPLMEQEQAIHVLMDGQREGFPNPVLGEGEAILSLLSLRRAVRSMERDVQRRMEALVIIGSDDEELRDTLTGMEEEMQRSRSAIERDVPEKGAIDQAQTDLNDVSQRLETAMSGFMARRLELVKASLTTLAENSEIVETVLRDHLLAIEGIYEEILLAHDEVVRYLDGYGIEEQSRGRAARKIAQALEAIPDVRIALSSSDADLPLPFLMKKQQEGINLLLGKPVSSAVSQVSSGSMLSGALLPAAPVLAKPVVSFVTIGTEFSTLDNELNELLSALQQEIDNPAVAMEQIDVSLRKLGNALQKETSRIGGLIDQRVDGDVFARALTEVRALEQEEDATTLFRRVAAFHSLEGDLSQLLFPASSIGETLLEQAPGMPVANGTVNSLMVEYSGVPYPLP